MTEWLLELVNGKVQRDQTGNVTHVDGEKFLVTVDGVTKTYKRVRGYKPKIKDQPNGLPAIEAYLITSDGSMEFLVLPLLDTNIKKVK